MSGEELALQTQLLLQEATQINAHVAVESVLEEASAPPPVNEFEAAQQALLAKLKRKKEASHAQLQKLNQQRYGPQSARPQSTKASNAGLLSPRKMLRLPVASAAPVGSRKKQDMLAKLRTQAIRQGAEKKAKFFGYGSYEEQIEKLNEIEKKKMRLEEKKKQETSKKTQGQEQEDAEDEDETEPMDVAVEMEMEDAAVTLGEDEAAGKDDDDDFAEVVSSPTKVVSEVMASPEASTADKTDDSGGKEAEESVKVVRRRNRIHKVDADEEDGNEADSEQDDKPDDADEEMEDADDNEAKVTEQEAARDQQTPVKVVTPKDKAAGYRNLLRAEALQNRKRKRLVKGRGDNFVESEAEEDEEEDALKIGGLGDFGFGVPQAKTQESREAEEERNALKLREGDLDHIVDDLSDEERAQEQDLEEMFRREQENQDRQQVKEVMRNVKEGFGRNRRAFSGLNAESGARGRFNLDELVAADGDKFEAARLGLLESDEELSEDEDGKKKKKTKKVNADGEEEEGDEEQMDEDEEAEMERLLRERFMDQPKIYVTSSESGSDDEEENEPKKDNGPDGDEAESDEERERQQMKLFSERARINRRMQRMKDMQRQIALENNEADPTAKTSGAMPNVLLEEDEDSLEFMHLLSRTDVDATPSSQPTTQKKKRTERARPKLGRFNSFGGSSSFSRVVGHCKLFSANSTGSAAPSKGFVFTSFSSDKAEEGGDENAAPNQDEAMPAARPELGKSKSWGGAKVTATKRRGEPGKAGAASKKRKSGGGLFSVLSSYQCVSSTSQSQEGRTNHNGKAGKELYGTALRLEETFERIGVASGGMSSHSHRNSSSSSSSGSTDEPHSASSSSSSSEGDATISGPYRVGNSDGDTCSYHALQDGASCRQPRTCYECLNSDVAGVSAGCLLAPSGFCEDMSSYESNLDFRRNTTGEDLGLTGWYNYFPSVNTTYCESTDEACVLCDELVNNGSLSQASHYGYKGENVSTEVERQFCTGSDGCVCVMACETDNWEANMPAECDSSGSNSGNTDSSSTDATSYSTMLIFYLVLQVTLLGVFMYKRGLCRRIPPQQPPARAEGPYNNVNAIPSPSNRLRLSGWTNMQKALIEREKKQRAIHSPQYMSSPRLDGANAHADDDSSTAPQLLTPQASARNNDSARAAFMEVQDESAGTSRTGRIGLTVGSVPVPQEAVVSVGSDLVVVEGSYEERITGDGVTRTDRASSGVAMLEVRRDAV